MGEEKFLGGGIGVGFVKWREKLPVWNRRNTTNKTVNANGAIRAHGCGARYVDSGASSGKGNGADGENVLV